MPDRFVINLSDSPAGSSPRPRDRVSKLAARYNASAAETTSSGREAYRDFPPETHGVRFTWPLGPEPPARG